MMTGMHTCTDLRCQQLTATPCVDTHQPWLSWRVADERPGASSTGYQVLAASRLELLNEVQADCWNPGRRRPAARCRYLGRGMEHGGTTWWCVRSFDAAGQAGPWSPPARWHRGPAHEWEWQGAQWIGAERYDTSGDPAPLGDWLWDAADSDRIELRMNFALDRLPDEAEAFAIIPGRTSGAGSFTVNGREGGRLLPRQRCVAVDLRDVLRQGDNEIVLIAHRDDGPVGAAFSLCLRASEGSERWLLSDATWQARPVGGGEWAPAQVLGRANEAPWGATRILRQRQPSTLLRRTFTCHEPPVEALLFVCGLGYHECWVNGTVQGDEVLAPAQTEYEDHAHYRCLDLTAALHAGDNVLGIWLGNGWYHQDLVWNGLSYGQPGAIVCLQLRHSDGRVEHLISDDTWRSRPGPIGFNNIYAGEHYDARDEVPLWASPSPDASGWQPVALLTPRTPRLIAAPLEPMRRCRELPVVRIQRAEPDRWIADVGEVIAGWVRLRVTGVRGQRIRLRFAENLGPDGRLDVDSTGRGATQVVQQDIYICAGRDEEVYEPRFTLHGFRYVELSGLTQAPAPEQLTAVVVHTAFALVGGFASSDATLDGLHGLMLASIRGNALGLPTDCPARERCGWTGDVHASDSAWLLSYDARAFFGKYLQDMLAMVPVLDKRQRRWLGCTGDIAPGKRGGYARFDWGATMVLLPWRLWRFYDDLEPAQMALPAMLRWCERITVPGESAGLIAANAFGDWCPLGIRRGLTHYSSAISGTIVHRRVCLRAAELAHALGEHAAANDCADLAERITVALRERFWRAGELTFGHHAVDALALQEGLIPEQDRAAVVAHIVAAITAAGHFGTGILSLEAMLRTLSRHGHEALALDLLTSRAWPNFGHQLALGCTTLMESIHPPDANGFAAGGSHNHHMAGGYVAWLVSDLLGIEQAPDSCGFHRLTMQARGLARLRQAAGHYDALPGRIASAWRHDGREFRWDITLPPGCAATVTLPDRTNRELIAGNHALTCVLTG